MVDESVAGGGAPASICPWCSASYIGEPERCPSCGATLVGDPALDPALPGLTALDPASILRAKTPEKRSRSRLLSWISGEYPDEPAASAAASEPGALAPPDPAVRREILRLEIEAEFASLQAEAEAIKADWMIEGIAPPAADANAEVEAIDADASDAEAADASTVDGEPVPAAAHMDAASESAGDAPSSHTEHARPS